MRKKLLLADDSITIQKVVELTFPSDEFEVVTAGNGRLAVDKALTFLPDIVLCDVIMPQLDGYQVCEALRASAQLSKVPILLLNGAFEPYDAERAKSVGALGNVSKPFDPPALVARVKEILNERSTAAFERPSVETLEAVGQAIDEGRTVEAGIPAATVPHEYTYDESETHPVSTVEVPLDVREMAARSLSLDAPVFAPAEPEVLTGEEPADFAETLHGPLDADAPAPLAEASVEMTAEDAAAALAEEVEAIEEIEPVAATGEFEAPAMPMPAAPSPAPAAEEPMEFEAEPETPEVASPLPPTLPPLAAPSAPVAAAAPAVHEFSGVHEFDPEELDTPVAHTAETVAAPESEAMTLPAELPTPEPIPPPAAEIALPVPAPPPAPVPAPAPPPAVVVPAAAPVAPAPTPAAAEAGAFDGLGEPSPAAVPPVSAPAPAAMPSAEVAVPVDMVQQIAQRVISQVSERVIREIAWDVIPGLAEKLIRAEIERIKARAESERD
ncbi:MAG TPA: response regulator [Vicinamibacteria bacterium]|nr:response regulator [Vicinamibacteria bacterium]